MKSSFSDAVEEIEKVNKFNALNRKYSTYKKALTLIPLNYEGNPENLPEELDQESIYKTIEEDLRYMKLYNIGKVADLIIDMSEIDQNGEIKEFKHFTIEKVRAYLQNQARKDDVEKSLDETKKLGKNIIEFFKNKYEVSKTDDLIKNYNEFKDKMEMIKKELNELH